MTHTRIFPTSHEAQVGLPPERSPFPLDIQSRPDPGLGHAIARHATILLDLGEYEKLSVYYKGLKWDERVIALEGAAKRVELSDRVEAWVKLSPNDLAALLFAGVNFSHRAWEARGGKLASDVQGGQWKLFGTWLNTAAGYLNRAIAISPSDPEAYARMMVVLNGDASLAKEPADHFFKKCIALCPEHLPAYMSGLTMRCEKWGGSHTEMFAFADQTAKNAPLGSLLHTLTPMAIMERMVYYMIENDYDGANSYLSSTIIRQRLAEVYDKTVGSGKLVDSPLTPILLNWLAAALIYSNSHPHRKQLLEMIGDKVTDRPWAYISNPVYKLINELRESYQLKAL